MKVALYARVSTQRQEKKGTIASQLEALHTYAQQQKYEVAEDYVCCDDGYSGTLLARPELDRLRDGAQAGAFDAILILSPDRLSRKYAYLILILEEFERFATPVIFLEQPPSDDPHSVLLVQIQGAVAESSIELGKAKCSGQVSPTAIDGFLGVTIFPLVLWLGNQKPPV